MYGVDRSVARLSRDGVVEGSIEGSAILEVKGRVGVRVMLLGPVLFARLAVRSQDVLFVSSCHLDLRIVVVMLLTRSAVPIWPPPPPPPPRKPKPQPLLGLFSAPIVFAAALMTALKSIRSWTAGVATAAGARIIAVTHIAVKIE